MSFYILIAWSFATIVMAFGLIQFRIARDNNIVAVDSYCLFLLWSSVASAITSALLFTSLEPFLTWNFLVVSIAFFILYIASGIYGLLKGADA